MSILMNFQTILWTHNVDLWIGRKNFIYNENADAMNAMK